jgi:glycosyltransferase involved in cell wall biosynthesis
MGRRVAITKSRLYRGGVLQVLIGLTRILNEAGLVPDLLTLKSNVTREDLRKLYGGDVELNIREIALNLKLPYEWHFLWFNLVSRGYLGPYDLIINSCNTSFLASRKDHTLSYVHYPRRDRVRCPKKSIHFPDGPRRSLLDIGSDPFRLASFLYKWDGRSHRQERVVANSEFTKEAILRNYDLPENAVQVVYPPVEFSASAAPVKKEDLVASLGRFSPEKRQLEQIRIAQALPELGFLIMGFAGDGAYYRQCARYVEDHGLKHVRLLANTTYRELEDALGRSRFFLHNTQNEPFGITTVQAIAKGCIPLVHDSGGQREIVPFRQLRFSSAEEAAARLRALAFGKEDVGDLCADLKRNNDRFREARFIEKMKPMLLDTLG